MFGAPILADREKNGTRRVLMSAGREVVKMASERDSPSLRPPHVVRKVLRSVKELAEFTPEFATHEHTVPATTARLLSLDSREMTLQTWAPTPASVIRLDELRDRVKVAFIHLHSLFEWHDTPASRFLAVAKRVAGVVLEPTAARLVGDWLEKLDRGDAATG